jgi:hypothetical protein
MLYLGAVGLAVEGITQYFDAFNDTPLLHCSGHHTVEAQVAGRL